MTNEMIERCARAISNAPFPSTASRRKARAVLKELMTPTDEMMEAGAMADDDCHVGTPYGAGRKLNAPELIWKAMLTEALKENP